MIWLIFIAVMLLSWLIQTTLQSRFNKYSRVPSPHGLTGADIARLMLRQNGINDVTVQSVRGRLTDHFNPQDKTINLTITLTDAHDLEGDDPAETQQQNQSQNDNSGNYGNYGNGYGSFGGFSSPFSSFGW